MRSNADPITRFTMGFRTLPQEAVPKELQAKVVIVQAYSHDKYKRIIGDVIFPDGTDVNYTLAKDGWCWRYRKYAPGGVILEELEIGARTSGRGLWADPVPISP